MKFSKHLIAALAATAIFAALPASAAEKTYSWNPYIGIDYQHTRINYDNAVEPFLDDSLGGFNIHAGLRPYKYLGAELGYFQTAEGKGSIAGLETKVKVRGVTFDAMGYLPVDESGTVELIGTAGVLWNKAKLEVPTIGSDSESEIDWRIGAGAQVNVADNVNMRGIVRYQTADFEDTADNAWVYTVGLNYGF